MNKAHENLDTLTNIAGELGINSKRLQRWAEPNRRIGFPEAKEHLGRYLLYDKTEVAEWYFLWSKISKNLGNKSLARRKK